MYETLVEPFETVTRELPLVMLIWFGFIGGCIGSFMNVVVYRLPLGMSLSNPPSRCPRCEHPIRWHDNIPVLGWLKLKGKCRDCKCSIPPRYPLVEALFMSTFALGWYRLVMLDTDGEFSGQLHRVSVFATLLATLYGLALIRHDRQHVPKSLFVPALLMPWLPIFLALPTSAPIADMVLGAAVGMIGMPLVDRIGRNSASRSPSLMILILVGASVGFAIGPTKTLVIVIVTASFTGFAGQRPMLDWSVTIATLTLISFMIS